MTDTPRYATLRDYLQVLRRNRLILLAAVILFGAGAWALTARDRPTYRATTSLSFQDPSLQTANLDQFSVSPNSQAPARVQINAATITRPLVVALVAQRLPQLPRSALTRGVSAGVDLNTGFLLIQVESTDPVRAQQLANAYALAVQANERQSARVQFAAAAKKLQQIANQPVIRRNPITATTYAERISNLQFSAQTADPVTIATSATTPTAPIAPHPIRDALLGVLLGLTVGMILAFARDALDRRLRGSEDVLAELSWPILGHVKETALGRSGFVAGNGRKPADLADLEAFRIIRQNIRFLNIDAPPRSIVVTSAKPEEGKSTVAAAIACSNALTGKLTLLIDCDLRRPSLAAKLGVDAEPGVTDYLLGQADADDILQTIPLGAEPASNGKTPEAGSSAAIPPQVAGSQLAFIPAGRPTGYQGELLSSQRLRDFLAEVSKAYDLVVIDAPPVLPVADALGLVAETEAALLCVRASQTTVTELRAVRQALELLPSRPGGVVITGVRSGAESDFGYYTHQYTQVNPGTAGK